MCTNIKHTNEYWLCWFPGAIVSSSRKTGLFKTINVSLPSSGYWHLQAVCGISMVMLLCKALGKKISLLLLWLWFWQQSLAYGCIVLLSGYLIIFSKSVSVCVCTSVCAFIPLLSRRQLQDFNSAPVPLDFILLWPYLPRFYFQSVRERGWIPCESAEGHELRALKQRVWNQGLGLMRPWKCCRISSLKHARLGK